jgi:membrane protein YdbS with pleckstrin-like domain
MLDTGPTSSPETEAWMPLAGAAVRCHLLGSLLLVPVPLIAWPVVLFFSHGPDHRLVAAGALGLTALFILNALRSFIWTRRFRFRVAATTVETRTGVITHAHRVVPLGRIQHVDVTSGPIERAFGIANVAAHTAAGDSTIVLPGVANADAEILRERLLRERRREAV